MDRQADQEGRTVMLTLRNAVDQTRKVAVEVPAGSTVRDAAIEAGIAQGESFDVFTAEGRAVTRDPVDDHGEAVLYVGPQKVAGGAMQLDEEPTKAIQFVSVYDHQVRNDVVPGEGQTVRHAAEVAGLTPRDGSQWQVFDDLGVVVDEVPAADMVGEQLYVGPEAIEAGSVAMSELRRVWSDYPSLSIVRGHHHNQEADLLSVRIPDRMGRSKDGTYQCVMDVRKDPPDFFVLNLRKGIRHPRVYRSARIPGSSTDSGVVCHGSLFLPATDAFSSEWVLAHLNQMMSALNE
jgi:hypothetical protein